MKYKKKDLRNPNLALLRRIERQEEKRVNDKKILDVFPSVNGLIINKESILQPTQEEKELFNNKRNTRIGLYDRRRGR